MIPIPGQPEELIIETTREVYEPAEDSMLLARHAFKLRGKVLEIGCGTGIASLYCAAADSTNKVEGVDINPAAVAIATHNAKINSIKNARFYKSNLFSAVKGKYDAMMFNAPYLPTSAEDKVKGAANAAFDGGKSGRKLVEKFIAGAPKHLAGGGRVLLVISSLTGLKETLLLFNKAGFTCKIEEEQPLFFEKLYLISAFFNNLQQSKKR